MQNKVGERGTPLQCAVLISAAVVSGQPVLLNSLAMVANETPNSLNPNATGTYAVCSFDLEGVFSLTVTAKSSLSPSTGSAVNPGDKIYADGGTTDTNSGITTGFTLDKNSSGVLFGTAVSTSGAAGPLLNSAATGVIAVRLKEAA
jgi:Uncharacterized conserved protein (DUF2190)